MTRDDIIRRFLDLHPDTPLDGDTRYAIPLGTISRMLEAAAAAEREKHEQRIDTLYRLYEQASGQRDQLMAAQVDAIRARVQA
jgi:hypothetical protein